MGRTNRKARRTPTQATADRHADDLASKLGRSLREGRQARRQTQAHFAAIAGISRSEWSHLEVARDGRTTLATWNRAATAVGTTFEAYLKQLSAADQPRDVVHLGHQELLIRTAVPGGWHGLPEEPIDREARTSRWGDVLLHRRLGSVDEYGLFEVFDWFDDVGAHTRDWLRRLDALERYADRPHARRHAASDERLLDRPCNGTKSAAGRGTLGVLPKPFSRLRQRLAGRPYQPTTDALRAGAPVGNSQGRPTLPIAPPGLTPPKKRRPRALPGASR